MLERINHGQAGVREEEIHRQVDNATILYGRHSAPQWILCKLALKHTLHLFGVAVGDSQYHLWVSGQHVLHAKGYGLHVERHIHGGGNITGTKHPRHFPGVGELGRQHERLRRAENYHHDGGRTSLHTLTDDGLAPANIVKYFIGPLGATKCGTKHLYIGYDTAVALVVYKIGCKAVLPKDRLQSRLEQDVGDN